ncbi:MAG: hypothetical protein LBE18_07220 [Planctomycetaceae bacterium]|nr:hypothetical protein [Planctomycetaceae bacterium]
MRGVPYLILWPAAFSEEQTKYFRTKFSKLCRKISTGDRKVFDRFCQKIYPFCMEIYETAKDLVYDPKLFEDLPRPSPTDSTDIGLPVDHALDAIAGEIADILPIYKNYLTRSEALHEMLCQVINEEKFSKGRGYFILSILPKTKRSDGIDFKRLIPREVTGGHTIYALLKLKDGRFVEEARQYLERYPKDWNKKQIARYIERYSTKSN